MNEHVAYTKIRGFSLLILGALRESPKSAAELSTKLKVRGNFLRSYLYNLLKYGLVLRDGVFWKINPEKAEIVDNMIKTRNTKEEAKVSKRKNEKRANAFSEEKKEILRKAFNDFLKQKKFEKVVIDIAK
ncbi:MAG: hypothetical protein ACP5IT_10910, partial [Thermoproteota archaeon]